MKRLLFLFLTCGLLSATAQHIERVEPLCWWTDMRCPLTLMLQGDDLCDAQVSIKKKEGKRWTATEGLQVAGKHNAESKNYLFVDLTVNVAGFYQITLQKGKHKTTVTYEIKTRREDSRNRQSFTNADVIYLIMSDRFSDGDSANNSSTLTHEKGNKQNIDGRWGGDIQGIVNHLDYIKALGATTIWPTPLLLDNEPEWSYHGYACGDYYHIDPRMGTNESYQDMVAQAHEKGLKVLMDIVTNHCGLAHWWMSDLPYSDWVHQFPIYTQTNNVFTTNYDINASQRDRHLHEEGWFDTHMPDMNLDNPDLLQYFKQWAIWWIEYADLDGLRVDTYPYNEKLPISEWTKAILAEYPNLNIVGECWTRPAPQVAYWQADANNVDGYNSHLPCVMDFPTEEAIRQALENDGNYWGGGLARVYDAIAMDYLYANPYNLLLFVGNHDVDRFADIVYKGDIRRVKIGMTLIATLRGIPQIFAGDEYGQKSSNRSKGHSGLRRPIKEVNELTAEERDLLTYQTALLQFRLHEPILHTGKTMHFLERDNTYSYFRYNDSGAVFVYINASEESKTIPVANYTEILSLYSHEGTNVLTGEKVELKEGLTIAPLSSLIIRLNHRSDITPSTNTSHIQGIAKIKTIPPINSSVTN